MNSVATHGMNPFDAIAQYAPTGEFWSARELMPLLGYEKWETFDGTIVRAMRAAANTGASVENHFPGARKVTDGGRWGVRNVNDYHLTRYACYLVAMNGDPRKAEVAAAQTYFAIRAREAETASAPVKSFAEQAAHVLRTLDAMVQDQAAQLAEQAPKVAQAELARSADGHETIGDLANRLKQWALTNAPGVKILNKDVFNLAGELGIIILGETTRNNQPTARGITAGWVKAKEHVIETNHGEQVKISARLTPKGAGRIWDAAIKRYSPSAELDAAGPASATRDIHATTPVDLDHWMAEAFTMPPSQGLDWQNPAQHGMRWSAHENGYVPMDGTPY